MTLRSTAKVILFAFIYVTLTKLGLLLALDGGFATLVWPGSGLALSFLLIYGINMWPAIAIGAFAVNFIKGGSPALASVMCIGNTLEALTAYTLLKHYDDVKTLFTKLKSVGNFIFASTVGSAISAVIGGTTAVLFCKGEFSYLETLGTWWLGNVTSCLLIVPIVLLFNKANLVEMRNWKIYLSLFLLLALSYMTFLRGYDSPVVARVLGYSLFIFPLRAALSQNRLSAILQVLIISSFAVAGTIAGKGPFIFPDLNDRLVLLQAFTSILAITTLIVSVGIKEKELIELRLSKLLKEKELLVSEVHHRVKNNLSVVSGLLFLHGETQNSEERKKIDEIQQRIKTIALVHEKLYKKTNLNKLEFSDYIKNLAEMIARLHQTHATAIKLKLELEELDVSIEKAVPVGLILNELLTNSYKHAFTGRFKGEIEIKFQYRENKYFLMVKDNGVGYQTKEDSDNQSIGLTLVNTLKEQINAEVSFKGEAGTVYEFSFN